MKKYINCFVGILFLMMTVFFTMPEITLAANGKNPLEQVDSIGNGKNVDPDQIYKDLNSILELIFYIAGFVTLISTVLAAALLGTAMGSPQRRNSGLIALGMALIGGWVLYKAYGLQQWVQTFGSSN
ncbi:hypothetical protein ACFYU8_17905 [Brevibacillus sp. NPDC003359]|uniref:hypothetical protein n=1 Tax=unclassified Brevibacillus TaxID=2684853 RepID=UPI00368F0FBA